MAMITDPIEALQEIAELSDCGISFTSYEDNYLLTDEEIIENAKHVFEQIDALCDDVVFSVSLRR